MPAGRHTPQWVAAVVAAFVMGVTGCGSASAGAGTAVAPARSTTPPSVGPPTSAEATTEATTPSAVPSTVATSATSEGVESGASVPPSRPREIYFPRFGVTVPVAGAPCPVVNGLLDPDRTAYGVACFYTAGDKPYTLPASATKDVTVLAGHTYRFGQAAFNVLYDWKAQTFAASAGDELWLRTEASGDQWLVYRAVAFHTPPKSGLATDASVWGTGPLPSRLLTIGCLQPTDLKKAATQNVVVAWDFARVARR